MFAVLLALHIFLHVLGVTGRANADMGDFGQITKDVEDKRLEKIEELMEEYIKRIRDLENTVKIQNNAIQELQENVNLLKVENRECEKTKKEFINSNEPKSDFKDSSGNTREKRLLIGSTPLPITKRTTSFYAYMKTHEPNPGIHHTFIFDVVKVNINGGYSPYSGVFTAPEEGVYVFTYSLRAKCNSYGAYELVKNSSIENVVIFSDTGACMEDHATGTIVLILNQGDTVFVRTHSTLSHTGMILSDYNNGYSYFAGWLISK